MKNLEELKKVDITTVNPEQLVDIETIKLKGKKTEDKIVEYVDKIRNPYCFLCNGYVVKIGFADSDITLTDRLQDYISKAAAINI